MIEIVLGAPDYARLTSTLLTGDVEHCAILLASQAVRADGLTRLLVRAIDFPEPKDYICQEELKAILSPDYIARVSKQARREESSLIFVHTHLGGLPPCFSHADDEGEKHLAAFVAHRHPGRRHAALVLSRGGGSARELGTLQEARVLVLGDHRLILFDPSRSKGEVPHRFDRQVRAFGRDGQRELERLRIGILGLGGTGSIVIQELVHLGVSDFVLVDPDVIDETNLNRVVGATAADIGTPKIDVAARYAKALQPSADITLVRGDITHDRFAKPLTDADLIFGCTDSHGSRAVLQQISYQYLIPCIDMGSTITAQDESVTGIHGRVQMLTPGYGCFTCAGLLNPEEIRRDMMIESERRLDPYIQGAREPAPAVVSINGTVASLAITMFLSVVTGIPSRGRNLLYNGVNSTLRAVRVPPQENCYICSRAGTFARGDSVQLYARRD
jgi:molybdopterin/thiamine biosynthesis adenylyltransferase